MCLTASADFIDPEEFPEETHDFVNESGKAALMAITRAVFTRSMCTEIFSAAIADSIRIVIIMTCCRNDLLFHKHCVTYGAVFAFGKTGFGTGRGSRLVNNDCMTLCRTFVCYGIRHITTVAFCGLGAVGCAGGIIVGNIVCEAVTGCRNDIFLDGVAANGAGTDCEAVALTSRCNNFCSSVFVRTLSLNFCFFESAVFTYQLVKSALGAGCFADYCFAEVVLMTENNVCF